MAHSLIPTKRKIPKHYVTISEAARIVGKSRRQVNRDIASGKLVSILVPAEMLLIDTRTGYIAEFV